MKKLLIGLGIFVGVVIVALLLVPMFVSVDKFRPQIQESINKAMRGKVELGELSLSAFPKVKLKVNGLKAVAPAPFNKAPFAEMKSAEIQMSLLSFLFSPSATLVLVEPKIVLVKDGEKSSLTEFLPAAQKEEIKETADTGKPPQAVGETLKGLPPFLASRIEKARFNFAIESGSVEVKDSLDKKDEHVVIKKLDLRLDGIGLRNPIEIDSTIDTDINKAGSILLGKMTLKGNVIYDPKGAVTNIKFVVKQDLKDLDLRAAGMLHKPAGTAFDVSLDGAVEQSEFMNVAIEKFAFNFDKVSTGGSMKLVRFGAPDATIDFNFDAPNVELAPFGAFIEMVRKYSLKGNSSLKVQASGPMENPNVVVDVVLKNVGGQTPELKHPISDLDGQIAVRGNAKAPQVNISNLRVKIASSDLAMNVSVAGTATAPVMKATINSKNLNFDELMGLQTLRLDNKTEEQKKVEAKEKEEELQRLEASRKGGAAMPTLDESLHKMAPQIEEALKNPMLDKAQANLVVNVAKIRAVGADYTAFSMTANYAKRKLSNATMNLKGYQGSLNVNMNLDLIPSAMGYSMATKMSGINLGNFMEIHAPSWKGMITGTTEGTFNISGAGLRKVQLEKSLNGSFKAQILNGTMKMPVIAMLAKVVNSVPAIGKKLENKEDPKGSFKTCKILSSIKGRMIYLDDMDVIYDTEKMNLGDMRFQSKGTVAFDRMVDITGMAYVEPGKIPVAGLRGGSGKDEIPIRFKGDMIDPKPDYEYTAKILLPKIARGALESKGGQKLKEEATKKLGDLLGGKGGGDSKTPEPVKKGIEDIKKRFGF